MRVRTAMDPGVFDLLFDSARRERLMALTTSPQLRIEEGDLADTEVLVTSWGAPRLDAELLRSMPKLRAVVHAAGSVQAIVSEELWDRDIIVTSAADANAVPVSEFTFAAIILSFKRAFVHMRTPELSLEWADFVGSRRYGSLGRTVGIVGFSRIGGRVVQLLSQLEDVRVLVADPFVSAEVVASAGGELVSLGEMLPLVDVLSLHAPALPETHHMIGGHELSLLRDGATVINTARGWIIDHDALAAACASGRLDAVLDVTDPDPLPLDSPLRRLPNVSLTPHIAGSIGTETQRLADHAIDDVETLLRGETPGKVVHRRDLEFSA